MESQLNKVLPGQVVQVQQGQQMVVPGLQVQQIQQSPPAKVVQYVQSPPAQLVPTARGQPLQAAPASVPTVQKQIPNQPGQMAYYIMPAPQGQQPAQQVQNQLKPSPQGQPAQQGRLVYSLRNQHVPNQGMHFQLGRGLIL